jgi:hypothetical protein
MKFHILDLIQVISTLHSHVFKKVHDLMNSTQILHYATERVENFSHSAFIHKVSLQCELFHDFKLSGGMKGFSTLIRYDRFLSTRNSLLFLKLTPRAEGFPTLLTHTGF